MQYCIKKFWNSILLRFKNKKKKIIDEKEEIKIIDKILKIFFLVWKMRWNDKIIIIIKKIYVEVTCLLRKAKAIKIGIKNHWYALPLIIDQIKIFKVNIDKNVEWWSTKGVPLDGYANIEKQAA